MQYSAVTLRVITFRWHSFRMLGSRRDFKQTILNIRTYSSNYPSIPKTFRSTLFSYLEIHTNQRGFSMRKAGELKA